MLEESVYIFLDIFNKMTLVFVRNMPKIYIIFRKYLHMERINAIIIYIKEIIGVNVRI